MNHSNAILQNTLGTQFVCGGSNRTKTASAQTIGTLKYVPTSKDATTPAFQNQ